MQLPRRAILLFTLNFLDAVMTIYWVHNGFATEGNHLMAVLLDVGYTPFLLTKIVIGATAAVVLWYWRNLRLAKLGSTIALVAYAALMGVHFVTGLAAFGFVSENFINDFSVWSQAFLAFIR